MGLSASVLGASGFSGGELVRLLSAHPAIEVAVVAGNSTAGKRLPEVQPGLGPLGDLELVSLEDGLTASTDICFSALPGGGADLSGAVAELVVDLSDDHRSDPDWVYGLPELDPGAVAGAERIANPGCFPTASLLALVPFARAGLISGTVTIDAISGISGAGRKPDDRLMFSVAAGSVGAYGTVEHRHVPEMERGLARFGGFETVVSFTPHLAPMERGLLVTARALVIGEIDDDAALDVLRDAYRDAPFVTVSKDWPATKPVWGSNRAIVSARVHPRSGQLIASAAIDNLGKGAAGQAIQNANLAVGLDQTTGLDRLGVWP